MKIIALTFFSFISVAIFSQDTSKKDLKKVTFQKEAPVSSSPNQGVYYSDYVIHPEKLKTYFVSELIPSDFPKYDKLKTFDENKLIAKVWAKANKEQVKQAYWHLFENN